MSHRRSSIHLKNVTIDQCGTGIRIGEGVDLSADRLSITNTRKAIEHTSDVVALVLATAQLPPDTPPELLAEALRIVRDPSFKSTARQAEIVHQGGLAKWLAARSVSTVSLLANLSQIAGSPQVAELLARFSGI